MSSSEAIKRMDFGVRWREWTAPLGFVTFLIAFAVALALLNPAFTSGANINSMLRTASISAIMFMGATWVFASGKIDVGFFQIAAVTDVLVAVLLQQGFGWPVACCAALSVGVLIGLFNGVLIAYLGLESLIVTLSVGGIAMAAAMAMGHGTSVTIYDNGFVGQFLAFSFGYVPAVALLAGGLYLLAWGVQEHMLLGHYFYAMADNERAVVEAGVPSKRITLILFTISGAAASLAGVLLAANLQSGQPQIGNSYFLDSLTAILLGAMASKRKKASVPGTLLGILFLVFLLNGTTQLGWFDWQQQIAKGCLLFLSTIIVARGSLRRPVRRAVTHSSRNV
jgi:ribose transport system permease protein